MALVYLEIFSPHAAPGVNFVLFLAAVPGLFPDAALSLSSTLFFPPVSSKQAKINTQLLSFPPQMLDFKHGVIL